MPTTIEKVNRVGVLAHLLEAMLLTMTSVEDKDMQEFFSDTDKQNAADVSGILRRVAK